MKIENFNISHMEGIIELWNYSVDENFLYTKMNSQTFKKIFLNNKYFDHSLTFVCFDDRKIIGFANGVFNSDSNLSYITMILVDKIYRKNKVGTLLLLELENILKTKNSTRIDINFFNPINLSWVVENEHGSIHPNAQGVVLNSASHNFFSCHGYLDKAIQNTYYRLLSDYTLDDNSLEKIGMLDKQGIKFQVYDKNIHHSLMELYDDLKNELWRSVVLDNLQNEKLPLLIASDNGCVIGWTGPMKAESFGRGYFAGIGVHSKYQGMGIGKILFYLLCFHLKELGARYMTLFTGDTNPARRMYEAAGFKIVKTYIGMSKNFEELS